MRFDVHGAPLEVRCADAVLADDVRTLLRRFACGRSGTAARLELRAVGPADRAGMPGPDAELLSAGDGAGGVAWPWRLLRERGRVVIVWDDKARLQVDADGRRAVAWVVDPAGQPADGRASVIFFAVSELLRRSGLFAVHAAAVERDGRALLLLAPSGGGKTTAMLSLLQAGWGLLSDDHPILCDGADGIEVLPFPVAPRVTAATAARFPGLDIAPPAGAKCEAPVGPVGRAARPAALLLTEIADWPSSRLEPIGRSVALERVLRLALGLASADRAVAARHFGLLGRLVRETPCYRLLSGAHVERDLPAVVDAALLEAAA